MSPLARRILAVNLPAFLVLVGAWFYLDQYRAGLLQARQEALEKEAWLVAGALGEAALAGPIDQLRIDPGLAAYILRRAVLTTGARTRLFDSGGRLVLDSRRLPTAERQVERRRLPPADVLTDPMAFFEIVWDRALDLIPRRLDYPVYRETYGGTARDWPAVLNAVAGVPESQVWRKPNGELIIGVAVPVLALKRALGALVLTVDSEEIDRAVRREQAATLLVFAAAVSITLLLSVFLSRSIIRPIRMLSLAAEDVRSRGGSAEDIPDLTKRRDEIGDLSQALRDMTAALNARVGAIEAFAADVAHEIKNPLTSLRSAIETLERTDRPEARKELMRIVLEDVQRLNRLISDISDASRIDAEMGRVEREPVDLGDMAHALRDVLQSTRENVRIGVDIQRDGDLRVMGAEHRLGQVLRNLVDNALSFSKDGDRIRVHVYREGPDVILAVEDQGPGIPEEMRERIFERFYTERPEGEAFGTHSGLGLNICRQIVEAHGGSIMAENVREVGSQGLLVGVRGARFTVRLPGMPREHATRREQAARREASGRRD